MTLANKPKRRYPSETIPGLIRKVDRHFFMLERREAKLMERLEKVSAAVERYRKLGDKLEGTCSVCRTPDNEHTDDCPENTCYDCGKQVQACRHSSHKKDY